MPKATINDVAELANVSIKTVSRVVNNEPNVKDDTRARVKRAIAKLKYSPNLSARNLASDRSRLIGLIYDDPAAYEIPSAGYVIKMQQGVLAACKGAHYDLLIHPCNYRKKKVIADLRKRIKNARPDGVVLAAPLSNMSSVVRAIEATGTPVVCISPGKPGERCSVATNDREISCAMTRHLASLGHTRIAFIQGHPSHNAVANRFLGYEDGLRESGLKFSGRLVCQGDNSIGSGEECATRLLSRKRPPTAIFAANDDMAAGVVRVADRLNIDIPGQLSVAGFDDIPLARQVYPALTTIRQPLEKMAETATRLLIEAGKSGPPEIFEVVPATLQERDSTGPAPAVEG